MNGNILVGLAGLAVGAVLTGGTQALIAWRTRIILARGAARILIDDLVTAEEVITNALAGEHWWTDSFAIPLDGWRENRNLLATAISNDDWTLVGATFHRFAAIERARQAAQHGDDASVIFVRYRPRLEVALGRTRDAFVVLAYRSLNVWERFWWKDKKALRDVKARIGDERAQRERALQLAGATPEDG